MKVPFLDLRTTDASAKSALEAAFSRVLASGSYILGPELEAFEREFAAYCGAKHCVGVANGLEALMLILRGYGIGPGCGWNGKRTRSGTASGISSALPPRLRVTPISFVGSRLRNRSLATPKCSEIG